MIILTDFTEISQICARHFSRETTIESYPFSKLSTLISNSNFVRQSFYEYRCESGIDIFSLSSFEISLTVALKTTVNKDLWISLRPDAHTSIDLMYAVDDKGLFSLLCVKD